MKHRVVAAAALVLLAACRSGDPIVEESPTTGGAAPRATADPVVVRAPTTAPPPAPARAGKHVDFDERIAWKPWDDAARDAKRDGRPIMLVIYADWCPHCRELSPVFADPEIQKLAKNLVMVHQNSDEDPPWLRSYASLGSYVPRILFLGPDGAIKADLTSGDGRYPYFYTPQGVSALKASMKRASGS